MFCASTIDGICHIPKGSSVVGGGRTGKDRGGDSDEYKGLRKEPGVPFQVAFISSSLNTLSH
jgi:hypothetical protein